MAMLSAFGRHRVLAFEMTRRDIQGRYRGASFGMLWSLISPFLLLLVYTLAFGFILKSRWPGTSGSTIEFALILFAGLTVHAFFAECLVRAPLLIVGRSAYVKRVVFPIEIFGWTTVLAATFHLMMNLLVLLLLNAWWSGEVHATALLLPIVLIPLIVLSVGVVWMVSALGVYLRDIGQVAGVAATAMLFLSSAIVPLESIPESYRIVFELNPLTLIIDQVRDVVIWGRLPDWSALSWYSAVACVFTAVAYGVFRRLQTGFADVL